MFTSISILYLYMLGILPLFQIKPPSMQFSLSAPGHVIHPKYQVLRGLRVFAPLTPVFGECYVLPQRFVIFAVKHHLPPKKGGIYIEFLRKAFK